MTFTKRRKWHLLIPFGLLTLLGLVSASCVADTDQTSGFNVRKTYTLTGGEQIERDQLIVAGEIKLEAESKIDGSVTLIGDQVQVDGNVNGDVVVIAEDLAVGDPARISGDLVLCVSNFERGAGARISGEVREECNEGGRTSAANILETGFESWQGNMLVRLGGIITATLFFGALAALGTLIIPQPMTHLSASIRQAPVATGGVGCLTVLVAVGLTVLYLVSLLLIVPLLLLPFMLLGWLALFLASTLGWIALAEPFGKFVFNVLRVEPQPRMVTAAIGAMALTLLVRIWNVFWFTGWIGALATIILGSVGLGAVVLTHAGTRPFPRPEPPSSLLMRSPPD
ncbi:MAG: hypothetical protein JXJ20_08085 [Anaerolineae bacterium]|jgi:hypothetical protein|nr:hypothetical protein [Anaerolineae bacterium]